MKNHIIKISEDTTIDLDKLIESRMLVQANSGGGKSYSLRRFIEQSFGKKQIIIIDPEGEFGNMRSEFDFVYIGSGGDAPAEVRSASLLARRLLETKANAIIDIYELGHSRGDFVKIFFEAVVNMPKELWTDCFFILDEAHKFAPEKGQGESVALAAVIDMASLGRKRGYCLIPATQRPAKLSKDVVAECNNKLIGRASLDIDRERSAKELGFRTKEDILSLRDLKPGEFYVFGPAISNEIKKTFIGEIKVKPPKRGTGRSVKIAPPTAKVKKWLAELADLPKEAEKEAKTIAEFKAQIRDLKTKLTKQVPTPIFKDVTPAMGVSQWADYGKKNGYWDFFVKKFQDEREKQWYAEGDRINKEMKVLGNIILKVKSVFDLLPETLPLFQTPESIKDVPIPIFPTRKIPETPIETKVEKKSEPLVNSSLQGEKEIIVKAGAKKMLNWLAGAYPNSLSKNKVATLSGFAVGGGTFDTYISVLKRMGWITIEGEELRATEEGHSVATPEEMPSGKDLIILWQSKFKAGAGKMLEIIYDQYPTEISKQDLADKSGFEVNGGTFGIYLSLLKRNGLIEIKGDWISISEEFFN